MSDPLQREWGFYISDMIAFAEKVVAYTNGLDQEKFVSCGLNYDAIMRNLSMVSEAATHIPDHIRTFASEINWQQYIGAHNRLIHNYWGINNDIVWDIIQDEIPVLIKQLHALKKAADENQIR